MQNNAKLYLCQKVLENLFPDGTVTSKSPGAFLLTLRSPRTLRQVEDLVKKSASQFSPIPAPTVAVAGPGRLLFTFPTVSLVKSTGDEDYPNIEADVKDFASYDTFKLRGRLTLVRQKKEYHLKPGDPMGWRLSSNGKFFRLVSRLLGPTLVFSIKIDQDTHRWLMSQVKNAQSPDAGKPAPGMERPLQALAYWNTAVVNRTYYSRNTLSAGGRRALRDLADYTKKNDKSPEVSIAYCVVPVTEEIHGWLALREYLLERMRNHVPDILSTTLPGALGMIRVSHPLKTPALIFEIRGPKGYLFSSASLMADIPRTTENRGIFKKIPPKTADRADAVYAPGTLLRAAKAQNLLLKGLTGPDRRVELHTLQRVSFR